MKIARCTVHSTVDTPYGRSPYTKFCMYIYSCNIRIHKHIYEVCNTQRKIDNTTLLMDFYIIYEFWFNCMLSFSFAIIFDWIFPFAVHENVFLVARRIKENYKIEIGHRWPRRGPSYREIAFSF